jgi:hypothetical protein
VRGAGEKPLTGRLGWLACDRRAGPTCAAIDAWVSRDLKLNSKLQVSVKLDLIQKGPSQASKF